MKVIDVHRIAMPALSRRRADSIMSLLNIYFRLLQIYGPQGWWPIHGHYHPNCYNSSLTTNETFEVAIGAILTQNTSWKQVEKALSNLQTKSLLSAKAILNSDPEKLMELIRPAGYFRQKAKKIKIFAEFFLNHHRDKDRDIVPSRAQLLAIWGIGPETADSILLYAYQQPSFVIDVYTKRIFTHLALYPPNYTYEQQKAFFEQNLPRDVVIYQEYHALIVAHAKTYYSRTPYAVGCPLQAT